MPSKRPLVFGVSKTGCFEIISHLPCNRGYPVLYSRGTRMLAHRLIWQECFGQIPPGLGVLHHCDNPKCINPEHLFLGTQMDNMKDRSAKNRQPKGEQQGHSILTAKCIKEIRRRYIPRDRKNGCCVLAREFGVKHPTISNVVTGKTWGWLE